MKKYLFTITGYNTKNSESIERRIQFNFHVPAYNINEALEKVYYEFRMDYQASQHITSVTRSDNLSVLL